MIDECYSIIFLFINIRIILTEKSLQLLNQNLVDIDLIALYPNGCEIRPSRKLIMQAVRFDIYFEVILFPNAVCYVLTQYMPFVLILVSIELT